MIRRPENSPERVKEVRRQLGLSREELAHALWVSFAKVKHWANGKTVPSKHKLLTDAELDREKESWGGPQRKRRKNQRTCLEGCG